MNIYRYTFACDCIVDGETIDYQLEIKTHGQLMVEDIIEFVEDQRDATIQEVIADQLHAKFGGEQTITGIHSNVTIITHRH